MNIFERIKSLSAFKFSIKNKYLDPSFFGDHIKLINILLLKSKEYWSKKYFYFDLIKLGMIKDKKINFQKRSVLSFLLAKI